MGKKISDWTLVGLRFTQTRHVIFFISTTLTKQQFYARDRCHIYRLLFLERLDLLFFERLDFLPPLAPASASLDLLDRRLAPPANDPCLEWDFLL